MSAQPLARFAGFDAMERPMGIGTGKPQTDLAKALDASQNTLTRIRRFREAARANPATAAKGGFPYHGRTCAEWTKT